MHPKLVAYYDTQPGNEVATSFPVATLFPGRFLLQSLRAPDGAVMQPTNQLLQLHKAENDA